MKRIIIILLLFFTTVFQASAETTIDFSSDKRNYNIEDTIRLNIELKTDSTGENQLAIEGIENFQIVGKQQSQSIININGKQNSKIILYLSLLAEKAGTYYLGPISIGSGTGSIQSDTIQIDVTGERIMVNPQLNNSQINTQEDEEEENIDDIVLNQEPDSGNISEEDLQQKIILGVDGEEMNDIYRDKGFLYSYALLKKVITIIVLILLATAGFILGRKYLVKYFESRRQELEENEEEIIEEKIEIDYQKLLDTIKKNYIDSDKEIFYAQTGDVYRTYLDDKVQEGLSKGSLKEVESFLKKNSGKSKEDSDYSATLFNFYKTIYFPEYNNLEDNKEERTNILEELEKLIIVKDFK